MVPHQCCFFALRGLGLKMFMDAAPATTLMAQTPNKKKKEA
jgi:hypothetical protein